MRSFCLLLVGALVGCGVEHGAVDTTGQEPATRFANEAPQQVGEVAQRAEFANNTLINEVQLQNNGMSLLFDADGEAITLQVFYSADKTTDTGRTPATPVLATTISMNTDTTAKFDVNLNDPAFSGFYGAIFVKTVETDPLATFQTYVQSGFDIWSVGGRSFNGGTYRIPYWSGCTGVVIAVTNNSNVNVDVTFGNMGHPNVHTISNLVPLSTFLFDSRRYNWDVSGNSSVQVGADNGGTIILSAYEYRGSTTKYRVVPVKASPWN